MRFNDILLEYNRDQTVKNYGPKILAIAVKDRSVPWLDIFGGEQNQPIKVQQVLQTPEGQQAAIDYIMEVIENSDPTKNKNYAQAITRLYSLGGTMLEDIGATLSQYLVKFDKLKNKKKIPAPHNDFMRYKSISEFYDVVDQLPDPDSEIEQQKISAVQLPPHNGWRYVYGSMDEQGRITSDVLVIQPLDQYSAYWWAKEYPKKGVTNRWCTAWEGDNSRFSYYNRQGPLYIIIPAKRNDDNEKYQFHFETKQFMDFQDHQIGEDGIANLAHRFPGLQKAFAEQAVKFNILGLMTDEYKAAVRSHSKVASQELDQLIEQYKERIAGFGFNSLSDYGINLPEETQRDLMPLIENYLEQCRAALLSKDGFWKQVVSKLGTERNEDRLEVILNTDPSLKSVTENSEAGQAIADLAKLPNIAQRVDASHLQDLLLRDPLFRFTMRQVPKLYAQLIAELTPVNEGYDMDQIRRDAEASLKANIDKQSDARIAALKNPPAEKSFLQKVGDKQIGMVKGAVKGAINGFKGISERDEYGDLGDDDEVVDDGFFVVIASEDEGAFVGMVTKDGGRWRESDIAGNAPHNWGGNYMSYLTPDDVMQHIRNDYRHSQVKGPFYAEDEAMNYARNHFDLGADDDYFDDELDEGWKDWVAGGALAAGMALGGGAHAQNVDVSAQQTTPSATAQSQQSTVGQYTQGISYPAAYTINYQGKDYKFAGRDAEAPQGGQPVVVAAGAIGIRGLKPVQVVLSPDGMYYNAPINEGRMKDIDIGRQDRDTMNPQQFRGQYKQSKDEWTADNKGVLEPATPAAPARKKAANTVEAYMEVYNKRDQREFKSMPFPSEKAAQRWADAHNAIIHSIVPLKGVSEQVNDEEPEDEVEHDDNKVAGRYQPDEFDELVNRVKAKAKEQERKHGPVDIAKLAARLNSIK